MSDACCKKGAAPLPAQVTGGGVAYRIRGMDCAEEVAILERALGGIVPQGALGFDVLNGRLWVRAEVPENVIVTAIAGTGMVAEPWAKPSPQEAHAWSLRDGLVVVSGLGTAAGFALHAAMEGLPAAVGTEGAGLAASVPWPAQLAYVAAMAAGLWVVLPKAWYAARTLRPDMNLLMTVAVGGALALGEAFEGATVAFLFALSLGLEAWSVGRARRAVAALLELAPDTVRVEREGTEEEVETASVAIDTVFLVRPGERIGLDGIVVSGRSEVDQAPITGESMPVAKSAGDTVFAGTINGTGALEVMSTKLAGETTLARIVRQVADSAARRAQSEQWIDRFARAYTPAILGLAVVVAILPPALLGGVWSEWIYRALVLLVIGCPCALVISTPVAIVASLAASARHGLLLKGGRVAELPAKLRVVALDKTGTLTEGRPAVVEAVSLAPYDVSTLLAHAAALEARSEHPLGKAILDHARQNKVPFSRAHEVTAVPGRGIRGTIDGQSFWLGSPPWLVERGLQTQALRDRIEALSEAGRTVVVLSNEAQVCGLLVVADRVRPEARAAVRALKRAGIAKVVMLTGDNRATADAIAALTEVDEVRAELLPEDKVAAIEALELELGPTAMVGDGVNDAPALARATLGVAMGAVGTDVAIETADVALMGDDLGKLAWLVEHSRATLAVIQINTALALGIKALFAALTFAGVASLWGAIAADMGVSLLVVAHSLQLLTGASLGTVILELRSGQLPPGPDVLDGP